MVRRTFEAIDRGDLDALDGLIADDVVEHEELPGPEPTEEGVLAFFRHPTSAFPDLSMTPEDMIAEGDRVFVRGLMTGTHRAEFLEIPATGSSGAVPFGDFFRVVDGRIAEHWGVADTGALLKQLGAPAG